MRAKIRMHIHTAVRDTHLHDPIRPCVAIDGARPSSSSATAMSVREWFWFVDPYSLCGGAAPLEQQRRRLAWPCAFVSRCVSGPPPDRLFPGEE
jgi:hypothetical protein